MVVELKDGVYWVGFVDWNIKKFHGHEYSTHRGTTSTFSAAVHKYLIAISAASLVAA